MFDFLDGVRDKVGGTMNKWWDKDKDGAVLDDLFSGAAKQVPKVGEMLAPMAEDFGDNTSDYMGTRSKPDAATTDEDYKPGNYEPLSGGGYGQTGGEGTEEGNHVSGPGGQVGKVLGGIFGGAMGPAGIAMGARAGGALGGAVDQAADLFDGLY